MLENIIDIANKLDIPEEYIECYGKTKAKISNDYYDKIKNNKDAKLILVTAVNPTPFGEGKTTQSIGIAMAMAKLGKKVLPVLREPSLGPVFGIKGGAIGGGKATIEPSEEINLHFTGDFHAITSANNLLCAVIDNHIFQGNELNIDENRISIKRAIDMNDRALRRITLENGRTSGFEITAACELMAICCLTKNQVELKNMIENIMIGYNKKGKPLYAKSLNVANAMVALLKDALKPNLVQTSEGTPCIVHLGPFANIAHGCNSIIATKMGMKMSDYCITEAGFGADLGAEKFFDIKCRKNGLKPDIAVLVVTIKALKYNGGIKLEELENENIEAIKEGIVNLDKHIENIKKYSLPIVVCINKFASDRREEIEYIKNHCKELGVNVESSDIYANGGEGGIEIANCICEILDNTKSNFKLLYDDDDSIKEKIEKVCKEIYGASNIIYSEITENELKNVEIYGYTNLPICIAKTPLSLSDDSKILGRPKDFTITITDIKIDSGAGFIVVYAGNIMTMPGLGKKSKYEEF